MSDANTGRDKPTAGRTMDLVPPPMTVRVVRIVRIGGRRLTLSWRPRKRASTLLDGLLRRSWRMLFGAALRKTTMAVAVCAAWSTSAMAAAPALNALPVVSQIVSGVSGVTQSGNVMTITQAQQAGIIDFSSFNVGASALLTIRQSSAAWSLLARVTGTDPSQIYGQITAPGSLTLINPNGIMVGPSGRIDVGSFIASTLNMSNDDFLAGRLTFAGGATVGAVQNLGTINTVQGGSVYLIGSSVTNGGLINAPGGEVILAAGQTVQLVDTGTPGVSVAITGSAGNVTNLGQITAEAGRIGLAAGLVNNSGTLNASSLVKEGGRIFLRASSTLATSATSDIRADGVSGGNVVLYSDGSANIDGTVSALGSAGVGGYVETSGKQSLSVVNTPKVGAGGQWYIDPYDLTIDENGTPADTTGSSNAIYSSGSHSVIKASTIMDQLNAGTSVTVSTGEGGADGGGNININSPLLKNSNDSTFTLNANNNIIVNADVTWNGGTLSMNPNGGGMGGSVTLNANVLMNGGQLSIYNNAQLNIGGTSAGSLTLVTGSNLSLSNTLNINSLGVLNMSGGQFNGGESISGLNNDGVLNLNAGDLSLADGTNTGGAFNVASGSTLSFTGYTNFNGTTNFGGQGNVGWADSIRINGGLTMAANGPALKIHDADLSVDSGSLVTNGVTTIDGAVTLDAGSIWNNGGQMTVQAVGSLAALGTDSVLTNQLGASLTILSSNTTNWTTVGWQNLVNNGTLTKQGSGSVFVPLKNTATGVVNIQGGTLGADFSSFTPNQGRIILSDGATLESDGTYLYNGATGIISGSGTISLSDILINNGLIAPGDATTTGTILLTGGGGYTQNSTGVLKIKMAGTANGQYDVLSVDKDIHLDGTLNLQLINGYRPVSGDRASFLVLPEGGSVSGTFATVTPASITLGDGTVAVPQVGYAQSAGEAARVTILGPSSDYFTNASGDMNWANPENWSAALPGASSNVYINAGYSVTHASGDDIVSSLLIAYANSLRVSGGSLTVLNRTTLNGGLTVSGSGALALVGALSGTGTLSVEGGTATLGQVTSAANGGTLTMNLSGGTLALTDDAKFGWLNVLGGTLSSAAGANLNVSEGFTQSGGNLVLLGDTALSQNTGDLNVGNVVAGNLVLEAVDGAIAQNAGTSLYVKKQLIASAVDGITLGNSGNRIAAFAADNSGSGDIVFLNSRDLSDSALAAVTLNGITNAGGNISINNTGATVTAPISAAFLSDLAPSNPDPLATLGIDTSGAISAPAGTVSIEAHSPLTIGSGGVSAQGNVGLVAGSSAANNDNLTVNGPIATKTGIVNLFAGTGIFINAKILGTLVANRTPLYGNGASSGVTAPVASSSNIITLTADTTSQLNRSVDKTQATVNVAAIVGSSDTSSQTTLASTQTVGGESGSFGGDDSVKESSTTPGSTKSASAKKPLPVCN
ncbi:filamentous hemagglutinin N-terminal domain-containing protein [Herbaspirillum sp. RTI4]|uniref:beta strand repeat-containing protein n=1 Tax=Herbaspirillum sp. RTI4 TaxID=3048640 RepID=UPI002AB458DF|nr:filamentous hemagglutinin N-terminal domain-containing protein [Herbaspirillum sp. RTI4]MDY7578470.1 filamentous hemagglutinin N-terminal domain-containing protein [Herbaspirillum sp. RTI4]MEA9981501.1 filamentous hemagglutinin N-terminal domain-containing protein [Herbaspirillum sp. RTI4]